MLGLKLPTDPRWVDLAGISLEEIYKPLFKQLQAKNMTGFLNNGFTKWGILCLK